MTIDELRNLIIIINNDLKERIDANKPASMYEAIKKGLYGVYDILEKYDINITDKPEVVARIATRQKISRPHFIQHYFNQEDEAMNWCKKHMAQSIACDPEFMKNIRFTTEDDWAHGCIIVTGEVLIAKHL